MSEFGTMALGLTAMLATLGYFPLQFSLARSFGGRWRMAALAPLAIMLPLIVHALFLFSQQSNLWPMFVILAAPVGTIYLLVLKFAKFVVE